MFKIPPYSRDFIFEPFSRGKDFCKVDAPDNPISYCTIRGSLRPNFVGILYELREPLWQIME